MANFKSYKASVKELSLLAEKLEKGDISKEEIDQLKTITQDLYERTVIINYKAVEEVYRSENKEEQPEIDKSTGGKKTEEADADAVKVDEPNTEPASSPVFDFADAEEDESVSKKDESTEDEFSFDFADDSTPDESPGENVVNQVAPQEKDEENNVEIVAEEAEPTSDSSIITERVTRISSDDRTVSFYEKFSQPHDESVLAMLSSQKLDSLKGAFGLNDRLQIINELFNGDADKFTQAIDKLDNLKSNEEARVKLSEIAAHHQWEPDHRLVDDFAKMVERRYA
jgi:hypothetical protein